MTTILVTEGHLALQERQILFLRSFKARYRFTRSETFSTKGVFDLYERVIAGPTNTGLSFLPNSDNSDTKLGRSGSGARSTVLVVS